MFKIATWNVNSLNVRLPHVLQWMQREDPDVFALQETKSIDENFPIDAIKEQGYHVSFTGQKTYNGVATISKSPIETISSGLPKRCMGTILLIIALTVLLSFSIFSSQLPPGK